MGVATTKPSWVKTVFQRLSVIFGPKRLSLDSGYVDVSEGLITIPENFSFETVIDMYTNYTLNSDKTITNKETLETISDNTEFQKKLEFTNLWRKCASGNMSDESDEIALPICFSDEAKSTYEKISKYSMMHLIKYGHIDTKEILDVTKNMEYRWSRQTARKLFKSSSQAKLITDYYRLATPNAKPQIEKTLTTDEALYG